MLSFLVYTLVRHISAINPRQFFQLAISAFSATVQTVSDPLQPTIPCPRKCLAIIFLTGHNFSPTHALTTKIICNKSISIFLIHIINYVPWYYSRIVCWKHCLWLFRCWICRTYIRMREEQLHFLLNIHYTVQNKYLHISIFVSANSSNSMIT